MDAGVKKYHNCQKSILKLQLPVFSTPPPTQEADIWSCGVIMYILLCGWPPFHGESTQQIFKSIMSKPLDTKSEPWPRISDAAKDCVRRMLNRDPM